MGPTMRERLGGDGETEMVGKDGMRNEYPTDFTNYKPNSLKVLSSSKCHPSYKIHNLAFRNVFLPTPKL